MTAFGKSQKEIMSSVRSRSPSRAAPEKEQSANIFALDTSLNCGQLISGETVRRSVKIFSGAQDFTIESVNGNMSEFEREQEDSFVKIRFALKARGNGDKLRIASHDKTLEIPVTYKVLSDPDSIRRLKILRDRRRENMESSGEI